MSGQPDMFPEAVQLSPKLAWMQKHGLFTHYDASLFALPESPETGETCYPWICAKRESDLLRHSGLIGVGASEDDAIWDFVRKNEIQHWSVEP